MKTKTAYMIIVSWAFSLYPLTWLGYGSDEDAWRIVRVAKSIFHTGKYMRSRTTGFPLFELFVTPLVKLGQWYLSNILPLVFGVILFMAFFRLANKAQLRYPKIALISLIFLPVVVKNATSTMDYIPALSLLIWAYVSLFENKWCSAGLFIGIACGFRPTSGLFVIPAALLTFVKTKSPLKANQVVLISLITGVIAYSPALFKYGIPNPYRSIALDRQLLIQIAGYNALQLFGIFQTLALIIIIAKTAKQRITKASINPFLLFHFSNIALWIVLFTFLPDEPEYLLPMVPSVILLLDRYLSKNSFFYMAVILLSYHIIQIDALGGKSGERFIDITLRPGYTIRDIQDRIFKLSTRKAATNYVTPIKTVLMLGDTWIPVDNDQWIARNNMYCQRDGNLCVSSRILDETRLDELHSEGFRIVAWRGLIWEYYRTSTTLPDYVEVIDDLSAFFGTPVNGKSINQR